MNRWPGIALILFSCCVCADSVDEVRCREIGFSLAAEAQDRERFASFVDEDARFAGDAVIRGRDAVVAAWGVFFEPGGPDIVWRPRFVEVVEEAGLALTRGPYRMRVTTPDGEVQESWGTFNSTWRRHADGSWRVLFDAGSPAGEAPPEDVQALLDAPVDCPAPAEESSRSAGGIE